MQSYLFLLLLAINSMLMLLLDGAGRWVFSLLQGLLFVGCLEVVHQCTHSNFFRNKVANRWLGELLSPLLFLDFSRYKQFHLDHHKFSCGRNDPERASYIGNTSLASFFILAPFNYLSFCRTVAQYEKPGWSFGLFFWMAIGFLFALFNIEYFIIIYGLPVLIFCYIDQIFNQAEHHGYGFDEPAANRRECANDIILPFIISWLFVHRSLHCVHHWKPQIRWFNAYSFFHTDYPFKEKGMRLSFFVKSLISRGVRNAE